MHTLVFLSTRQVLQCQPEACQALPLFPRELFPLLFKVAFMDKETVVLRELVHTWPFPLLSFQQLLQECAHCNRALLWERPSTESVQAVTRGLTARLHTPEAEAGTRSFCRKHALRLLDMTGLLDDGVERDPGTMSMWDCTAAVARTCVARQQGGTVEPGLTPAPVEVCVDLRVNQPPMRSCGRPSEAAQAARCGSAAGTCGLRTCPCGTRWLCCSSWMQAACAVWTCASTTWACAACLSSSHMWPTSSVWPAFGCTMYTGTHGSPPWMHSAEPPGESGAGLLCSAAGGSALPGTQPPRCPPQEAGPVWQRPVWQPAGAFPGAAAGGSGHTAAPRADRMPAC
uniref:Leucine rich repeat containing 14 n=1 Tax=Pipistrellus kuhlii TaxID=59472 RepID=A0A7J7RL83_PIPKU|nr:leucine rich repeat containing 14 [Pipistrellus kuhlii]